MSSDKIDKARENRLRRAAERQGLRLAKSHRRDPRAIGYGTYTLADGSTGALVAGERLSADAVERYLLTGSTEPAERGEA